MNSYLEQIRSALLSTIKLNRNSLLTITNRTIITYSGNGQETYSSYTNIRIKTNFGLAPNSED